MQEYHRLDAGLIAERIRRIANQLPSGIPASWTPAHVLDLRSTALRAFAAQPTLPSQPRSFRLRLHDHESLALVLLAETEPLMRKVVYKTDEAARANNELTAKQMLLAAAGLAGYYSGFAAGTSTRERDTVHLLPVVIEEVEVAKGFDPFGYRTFMLVHELVHRAQLGMAPWLRGAVLSLSGASEARSERRDGGVSLTALQAVLEGHAVAMTSRMLLRVGIDDTPFRRTLLETEGEIAGAALRDKAAQYKLGYEFVRGVEDLRGEEAISKLWTTEAALPTQAELANPASWVSRVDKSAHRQRPSQGLLGT